MRSPALQDVTFKTLLFGCEMSPLGLCVCGPQIMVLFGEVVVPVGGGALREEVSY